MHNFKQYLEEGRDAPLYHGTTYLNAQSIIQDNKINASTTQKLTTKKKDMIYTKNVKGTSFSRSLQFVQFFKPFVIFEIDQRKLDYSHKIIPFNYFANDYYGGVYRTDSPARFEKGLDFMNEHEEFVVGDIKNIDKYITRIFLKDAMSVVNDFNGIPIAIRKHPKLYMNGDFVNKPYRGKKAVNV